VQEFTVVWPGSAPCPVLAYRGFEYRSGGIRRETIVRGNLADFRHIGKYGDLDIYVRKEKGQTPPQTLWVKQRAHTKNSGDLMLPLFKRAGKVSQSKSQIDRSTRTDSDIELKFSLPQKKFTVSKEYAAKAWLVDPSRKESLISTTGGWGESFEITVLNADGTVAPKRAYTVKTRKAGHGSGLVELDYKLMLITFNKPGSYKVYCHPKDVMLHKVKVNSQAVDTPLNLKTEPISILVR
jgi:hypothetical protein